MFDSIKLFVAAIVAFLVTSLISVLMKRIKAKNRITMIFNSLDYNVLAKENFIDSIVSFFSGFVIFELLKLFVEPKSFFNLWGFAFWKNTIIVDSFYFSIIGFIVPTIIGSLVSIIVISLIKHNQKLMLVVFLIAFSSLQFLIS